MADKTWKEKRAEQDRVDAVFDAKRDAAKNAKRGPIAQALDRVTRPVANTVFRGFETPEYSKTYEQTYNEEMNKGEKGSQPAFKKGGTVRGWGKARSVKKCKVR